MRAMIAIGVGALLAVAPAGAQDNGSLLDPGSAASLASSFAVTRVTQAEQRQRALDWLDRVCEGRTLANRRSCDRAWGIINAAYADLQARRAAEAAQR